MEEGNVMKLMETVSYLDTLLNIKSIDDISLNGLQVENSGEFASIYCSVDISGELVERASENSLIIVHHGLFWGKPLPITRNIYKIIRLLINKNCALYASHIPIDLHNEFGNNHGFYKLTGWESFKTDPFSLYNKLYLSSIIEFPEEYSIDNIIEKIIPFIGNNLTIWDFGKKKIKTLGFASGGGSLCIGEALEKGLDLYITGETSHNSYWKAKENNMNIIFAGHYNTEQIGVKLLGKHLSEKCSLPFEFIDLPTGL